MDRLRELEHLSQAEAHIAEGEVRMTEQAMRVERLRADGHDTAEAEIFLQALERTLTGWRAHRHTILNVIAEIDAGLLEHGRPREAHRPPER